MARDEAPSPAAAVPQDFTAEIAASAARYEDTIEAPMGVVPYATFRDWNRIPRNSDRLHVQYDGLRKTIFVSHRWHNALPDRPELGHPDSFQHTKHWLICHGVQQLAEAKRWSYDDVDLWIDYSSIDQDDLEVQAAGIKSLIGYLSKCHAMLIPTGRIGSATRPELLPEYGQRAWTRLEYMLYCNVSYVLRRHPQIYVVSNERGRGEGSGPRLRALAAATEGGPAFRESGSDLPSRGSVTCEKDRAAISELELSGLLYYYDAVLRRWPIGKPLPRENFPGVGAKMLARRRELQQAGAGGAIAVTGARKLPVAEIAFVVACVRLNPACSVVNLARSHIGDDGAAFLAGKLLQPHRTTLGRYECPMHSVTNLSLIGCGIGDAGVCALAASLMPFKNPDRTRTCATDNKPDGLKLDLRDNEFGSEGAAALAKAAEKANLTLVWASRDMSSRQMGDAGAQLLAAELSSDSWGEHSTVTSINVESNGIGDAGAQAMASALKYNGTVGAISFLKNHFSGESVLLLRDALLVNHNLVTICGIQPRLEKIRLDTYDLGDTDAMLLAAELRFNETITSLDLQGNRIGDAGAAAIEEALKANTTLIQLNLAWNPMSEKSKDRLKKVWVDQKYKPRLGPDLRLG